MSRKQNKRYLMRKSHLSKVTETEAVLPDIWMPIPMTAAAKSHFLTKTLEETKNIMQAPEALP